MRCSFVEVSPGLWRCPVHGIQIPNDSEPIYNCEHGISGPVPPGMMRQMIRAVRPMLEAVNKILPLPPARPCNCGKKFRPAVKKLSPKS
jgi:hypothetical protein